MELMTYEQLLAFRDELIDSMDNELPDYACSIVEKDLLHADKLLCAYK